MVSGNSGNINLKGGGGGQPMLQPLLQKGKLIEHIRGSSFVGETPFDEQVPLQSIGPSVDGARAQGSRFKVLYYLSHTQSYRV